MLKLFAGAGLMLVAFYLGINVEKYYKRRFEIFKEFYDFLQYASREINFFKTDIITIADNYSKDKNTIFTKVLKEIKKRIMTGEELKIEEAHLNAEEKRIIVQFFESISKSDFSEQAKLFTRYNQEMGDRLKISQKQKKEKGELFKKLFILLGVGLMIILI